MRNTSFPKTWKGLLEFEGTVLDKGAVLTRALRLLLEMPTENNDLSVSSGSANCLAACELISWSGKCLNYTENIQRKFRSVHGKNVSWLAAELLKWKGIYVPCMWLLFLTVWFLTQDSLVLLMVKQCKHCGLSGKFSSGVTEISTAQSHYQLHLIYFSWFQNAFCGSFTSFLSSQKLVHFNQTKSCISWTTGCYLSEWILFL